MSFADAVRAALPERYHEGGPGPDICGHALGQALGTVRPVSAAEVATVVQIARARGGAIAVAGARTAYWRPLDLEGALVIDTRGLSSVGPVAEGAVEAGAGVTIAALSAALAAEGRELTLHPDAFGDSTLGGMIATGLASGIGMGRAHLSERVTGLEVVLGTGEVLRTGASRVLGHAGFARLGLPDPTGLFVGAEGALGIVTGVCLRAPVRRPRAALSWRGAGGGGAMRAAIDLARDLGDGGEYDTLRVETKSDGGAPVMDATLVVHSPFSEGELDARLDAARALVERRFEDPITTQREPRRFWGAPEDHFSSLGDAHFRGVDVVVGGDAADAAVEAAGRVFEAVKGDDALGRIRAALYFAPGYVNLGIHAEWRTAEAGDAFVAMAANQLSQLAAVPYRWGRGWLGVEADPVYQATMRGLAAALDPDAVLRRSPIWEPA